MSNKNIFLIFITQHHKGRTAPPIAYLKLIEDDDDDLGTIFHVLFLIENTFDSI